MGRAHEVRKVAMAKTAAAKSKVNGRFAKEIYMAAKGGTPDPEANLALKSVIEKAKKAQVPADVIKRSIDKAKGGAGEDYAPVRYEGFGPGNSLVIVDCLTDNVNRTITEVRNAFTKSGSKLGMSGSVVFQFDHNAVISTKSLSEEEVLEALVLNDIDADIEVEADNLVCVYGQSSDYSRIKQAVLGYKENVIIEDDEITFFPQATVFVKGDDFIKFEKLYNMLDVLDDVQEIYHNAIIEK